MKWICHILLLPTLILTASALAETDLFYPAEHHVLVSYEASRTHMTVSDTLILSRSLFNGEVYSLTGLYFADNLPPEFAVISCSLSRNGQPVGCDFSGRNADSVVAGYDAYQWVVDWPDSLAGFQTEVLSGDSLHLEMTVICEAAGSYSLPLHTLVCCGNGGQMFAVSSAAITITVDASVDVTPPGRIEDLNAQTGG